ncbi:hypothetical protein BWR18_19465 (plasmid) [Tateyamaria omphalii]|uniref:Glycosyltransferase RgtA/B/C/D-like domain-containing protein n=2 Tax=Tateyamaria omphalii TaxID=299262 RepID=A0A1P8N169_9RHOB|nr:hypothetical protein BWR18_19465 [Tateyamaria omphalii]
MMSPVAVATWATTLICGALLVLPGVTASSMYFNDILIFLDGAYRVVNGQVPNQDFHTALGPLNYYLPGLGYWMTDRLGMAMPVGMAALMLVTAPIMIHVLGTRLRPLIGVPLAIFLVLLLATPMNTGEIPSKISFAMFYNRIGWVLLGILLVLHLHPERTVRWQGWRDAAAAATLTMLLVYTKMTYGVVALCFLVLLLLQPAQRRWAGSAIALCIGIGLLVEIVWGGTRMHIADLIEATRVSGVIESYIYVRSFLRVSGEYAVFALIAGLALWHQPRITDALFYFLCGAAGFALLNQNFQHVGIVTMLVGGAVAAEILLRHQHMVASRTMHSVLRGAPLAVGVLLMPIALSSATAIGVHAVMASTRAGVALETPNGTDVRIVNVFNRGQFEFYERYAQSLGSGAALLASLENPGTSRVLVMDFVSPFASLAGLPPQEGGNAWMHDNRNFDLRVHLPAQEMLSGVDVVMIPKHPVAEGTTQKMQQIYGAYLEEHFELTRDTGSWSLYQRRPTPKAVIRRPVGPRSS